MTKLPLIEVTKSFPYQVRRFFNKLDNHSDYSCKILAIQLQFFFRNKKVGGFNRSINEWYFSKVFIENHKSFELLQESNFEFRKKTSERGEHQYWSIKGFKGFEEFQQLMTTMTRVPL